MIGVPDRESRENGREKLSKTQNKTRKIPLIKPVNVDLHVKKSLKYPTEVNGETKQKQVTSKTITAKCHPLGGNEGRARKFPEKERQDSKA